MNSTFLDDTSPSVPRSGLGHIRDGISVPTRYDGDRWVARPVCPVSIGSSTNTNATPVSTPKCLKMTPTPPSWMDFPSWGKTILFGIRLPTYVGRFGNNLRSQLFACACSFYYLQHGLDTNFCNFGIQPEGGVIHTGHNL